MFHIKHMAKRYYEQHVRNGRYVYEHEKQYLELSLLKKRIQLSSDRRSDMVQFIKPPLTGVPQAINQ